MKKITYVSLCSLLLMAQLSLAGCGPVGAVVGTTANVAIGVTSAVASVAVGAVTAII
jgi:hypothetical protein